MLIEFKKMQVPNHQLKFRRLAGRFAVCRLEAEGHIPEWAASGQFSSVTRTEDELSIVCPQQSVPADVRAERGWVGLKLEGPFAFSQAGILAAFIGPLAESGVAIFAISTFDTDYVLVKEESVEAAVAALRGAGHCLIE